MNSDVVGFVVLLVALTVSGTIFPLGFAVGFSWLVTWAFQKFVTGRKPVPARGAVIITGCSSGIGYDAALHLAAKGFVVFAGVRKAADGEKLTKASKKIVPVILDVSKQEEITSGVQKIQADIERDNLRLIGLVNNAGYNETGVLEILPIDKLRRQLEVNVVGQVAMTQAVLPLFRKFASKEHRSRLVFIGSGFGIITFPNVGAYCASKHAVEAIADAFRMELQSWNIDTVLIQPGSIKTNFLATTKHNFSENVLQDTAQVDEVARDYAKRSSDFMKNQVVMEKLFATTAVTNEAIEASLLDASPRTRYKCGLDSTYLVSAVADLPDIIRDRVFGRFYK